jgi:LysM repeat protein
VAGWEEPAPAAAGGEFLARMQVYAQQLLGDQVTPLRLASHLSVLLVGGIVLLFSQIPMPSWDFQLVAMPTSVAQASAQRGSGLTQTLAGAGSYFEVFTPAAVAETRPGFIHLGNSISAQPRARAAIQTYTVQAGDTVLGIAEKYGLQPETLQWANPDLEANPDLLSIGDQITILPQDGVLHTVRPGDTLAAIASRYSVDVAEIVGNDLNRLPNANTPLIVGQQLVIAGGTKPYAQREVVGITTSPVAVPDNAEVGSGNFGWPASGSISQRYWGGHPALDITGRVGAAVTAADGGYVTYAGSGWNAGYGTHVIIDHGNGFATLYAHLNSAFVSAGENVSAGQQIGTLGSTGNSTGPHLHFEIRYQGGPRNPYNFLP